MSDPVRLEAHIPTPPEGGSPPADPVILPPTTEGPVDEFVRLAQNTPPPASPPFHSNLFPPAPNRQPAAAVPAAGTPSAAVDGVIDLSGINPVAVARELIPRLHGGEITLNIPFRPGRYPLEIPLPLSTELEAQPGYALATFRFSQGEVTEMRAIFHPPLRIMSGCLKLGEIEEVRLRTTGSSRGRIIAKIDLFDILGGLEDELVPDPDLAPQVLKALWVPPGTRRLPTTVAALSNLIFNRITGRPPPTPRGRRRPPTPQPFDLEGTRISYAEFRVRNGPLTVGPATFWFDQGEDRLGNRFTIVNSTLNDLRLGRTHLGRFRLLNSAGAEVVSLTDVNQSEIHILRNGGRSSMRSENGRIGSARVALGGNDFETPNGLQWDRFSVRLNERTLETDLQLSGLTAPLFRGRIADEGVEFDLSVQNGDAFIRRRVEPETGGTQRESYELRFGIPPNTPAVLLRSAHIDRPSARFDLETSFFENASATARFTRRLAPGGSVIAGSTALESLQVQAASPRLRISRGDINIASWIHGGGEADRVVLDGSTLHEARMRLDMEPDHNRIEVRGVADMILRGMQIQFGRQLGEALRFGRQPILTDIRLGRTRVTGPVHSFQVTQFLDPGRNRLRMEMRGEMDLSGEEGSGDFVSPDILARFDLHTDDLNFSSRIRHLVLEGGIMQEIETGPTEMHLRRISGVASGFGGVVETGIEANTVPPAEGHITFSSLRTDFTQLREPTAIALAPIDLARFEGFNLGVDARSTRNTVHLNPGRHRHEGDWHLRNQFLDIGIRQRDETILIRYDPVRQRTFLVFRGGRIQLDLEAGGIGIGR